MYPGNCKKRIGMKNYIGNRNVERLGTQKGDRNTKFYHALTKQSRIQNKIVGLHNRDGN